MYSTAILDTVVALGAGLRIGLARAFHDSGISEPDLIYWQKLLLEATRGDGQRLGLRDTEAIALLILPVLEGRTSFMHFSDNDSVASVIAGNCRASRAVASAWGVIQLRGRTGWEAARLRATHIDSVLNCLFMAVRRLFPMRDDVDFLIRGSQGHGLPSCWSDIDFEISGMSRPNGDTTLEAFVEEFCSMVSLNVEGSKGRPIQEDLTGTGGLKRDLHEWCELRRPGSSMRDVGWLAAPFSTIGPLWWMKTSEYEEMGRLSSAKYAFFEARALICRTAFSHGSSSSTTDEQLIHLEHNGQQVLSHRLRQCVLRALLLYESECPAGAPEVVLLQDDLARLRRENKLPGPSLKKFPLKDSRNEWHTLERPPGEYS